MNYYNQNQNAAEIFKAAQSVAIPGGRENGNIQEFLASQGTELPAMPGRCLHLANSK